MQQSTIDWDLVSLIFMVTLLVGLYCWNRFGGSSGGNQRKYAFAVFLMISLSFSVFMNTGNRPGGIFIVA